MTTIAHISDLHFGRVNSDVVRGLLADLEAAPPDLIVVSGDFTQAARRIEFRAARAFLDRLPGPWFAVPGNHDIPPFNLLERFVLPYRSYRRWISPVLEPVWSRRGVVVVGVNTARRIGYSLNWAHGRISSWQIGAIEQKLRRFPEARWRIVVAHHPFLPPPGPAQQKIVMRSALALRRFAKAGVDAILAGHLHRAFHGHAIEQTHDDTAPHILVVQASTATSSRTRAEPNAYNRLTLGPENIEIETRTWTGDHFRGVAAERFDRVSQRS